MFDLSKYSPGTPFRRAKATYDAIAAAHGLPRVQRNAALAAIPAYRSRGKGIKTPVMSTSGIPSGNKCNNSFDPSGHNGEREMARRVRQMQNGTHGYVQA